MAKTTGEGYLKQCQELAKQVHEVLRVYRKLKLAFNGLDRQTQTIYGNPDFYLRVVACEAGLHSLNTCEEVSDGAQHHDQGAGDGSGVGGTRAPGENSGGIGVVACAVDPVRSGDAHPNGSHAAGSDHSGQDRSPEASG